MFAASKLPPVSEPLSARGSALQDRAREVDPRQSGECKKGADVSMKTTRIALVRGVLALGLCGLAASAQAQIGTGWTRYYPTKKIHLDNESGLQTYSWTSYKSVCSPVCADYRYDSGSLTETFRLLDNR